MIEALAIGVLVGCALALISFRPYNEGLVGHAALVAVVVGGLGYLMAYADERWAGHTVALVLVGCALFFVRHVYRVITRSRRR